MAAETGEECVLLVFADVHYYFSAPIPRPLSHRFDKGSYLYLYRYTSHDGGRLQIANNVGKPEQDAFTGSLSTTKIQQSHKHPTRVTVTVDGYQGNRETASPPIQYPEHQWRLPNTDPRNEGRFLFRLHTLDIYFWTNEAANSFIDIVGKLLQQQQLEILDVPQPPIAPKQIMSTVVQRNVAIQDHAYHNGQTQSSGAVAPPFSPPPVAHDPQADASKIQDPRAYKPLPYDPAAPPAPEPPPESNAAAFHQDQTKATMSSDPQRETFSPSLHTQVNQGNVSPHQDPGRKGSCANPSLSTGYVNSQPSVPYHRGSSVSYLPSAPLPSGGNPSLPYANTVLQDPNPSLYGKPLQHYQPEYPTSYLDTLGQSHKPVNEYDIHNQVYTSTEPLKPEQKSPKRDNTLIKKADEKSAGFVNKVKKMIG